MTNNTKLKKFGIYTTEYNLIIVIEHNDEYIAGVELPLYWFSEVNNKYINNILTPWPYHREYIFVTLNELINTSNYAYLGQFEDKCAISDLKNMVRYELG